MDNFNVVTMTNDLAFCSNTVGVCMKTEIPKCFSVREKLFIVQSMVKDFKEIFTAMEELMGYRFNIDVSGGSENCENYEVVLADVWRDDFQIAPSGQVICWSRRNYSLQGQSGAAIKDLSSHLCCY